MIKWKLSCIFFEVIWKCWSWDSNVQTAHFNIKLLFLCSPDIYTHICNVGRGEVRILRIVGKKNKTLNVKDTLTKSSEVISEFCLYLVFTDVQWLWNQDASRDLLLAIHPPNYIVLWNADTGTKLWKKSYADNILSFSFDPFDPSHLTCE